MRLTLEDCYALLRDRVEAINAMTAKDTQAFWQEIITLGTEGLERACEREAQIDKQMPTTELPPKEKRK